MAEPTDHIEITDEVAQRRIDIRDAWNRYDGTHPDSLTPEEGEQDDNTVLNNLATIVDTGVDFLFGGSSGEVSFAAMRDSEERDAKGRRRAEEDIPASEYLEDVWKANRKKTWLRKHGTSAAISGHAAVKIAPAADPKGMHRLTSIDPLNLAIRHAEGDIETITGYAIDTLISDAQGKVMAVLREEHTLDESGQSWTIRNLRTEDTAWVHGMWSGRKTVWVELDSKPWPHPFPAIVDGQNLPRPHELWGRPDLSADILQLNESINRVASNESKTLRHFAHPVVWGSAGVNGSPGQMQAEVDASIGAMICLAHGSTLNTLQMQAEGPAAAAAFRESLEEKQFEVARIARVSPERVAGSGALSGVALLLLYRPTIAKTETKRDTQGDVLREVNRRLLVIAGFAKTLDDIDVIITWPEVLPRNQKEETEVAEMQRALGVSLRTLFERLGIDFDTEMDRLEEENSDPMGDMRGLVDRLAELEERLAGEENPATSEGPPSQSQQDDPEAA